MQAVGSGLVVAMLPCLSQGSLSLSTAIVEAFMQITIAVQGKQAMVSHSLPLLLHWVFLHGAPRVVQCYHSNGLRQQASLLIGAMHNAQVAWLAYAKQYVTVRPSRQCACRVTQLGFRLSCKSVLYKARSQV